MPIAVPVYVAPSASTRTRATTWTPSGRVAAAVEPRGRLVVDGAGAARPKAPPKVPVAPRWQGEEGVGLGSSMSDDDDDEDDDDDMADVRPS